MLIKTRKQSEAGMVLIVTLGFLIAMMIIVGYTATRSLTHGNQMQQSADFDQAFLALEGAHERIEDLSLGANEAYIGLPNGYRFIDTTGANPVLNLPPGDDVQAALEGIEWQPLEFAGNGVDVSWVAMAVPGDVDGIPATGDEIISYYMASRVTRNGQLIAYRAAEDTNTEGENINVWTNAIFAGVGQGGALINGNVSIHGPVHLLGNDPNAVVVTALDMSGTSFIHNSYGQIGTNNGGIPTDLANRIGYTGVPGTSHASFDFVDWNGDGNANEFTLNANLRIKNGTVDLGGNSVVGQDGTSSTEKYTMDGVFIADGGGDEVLSGSEKIFSDNGFTEAYDIGVNLELPTYNDDGGKVFVTEKYLEGFNATQWVEPDGTTHVNPTIGTNRVFTGNITLQAGGKKSTNNFYWNANVTSKATMPDAGVKGVAAGTGNMPTEAQLAAKIAAGENFIWYNSSANPPKLVVNGRVPVDGNMSFTSGTGQNDTFEYTGKGTIAAIDMNGDGVGGDNNIDANLRTTNYPHDNLLGLMSQNDMHVGGSSQLDIMGGFYAQGTVSMDKQTNVVGALVGNYFDLGSQVPNIYWVPGLPDAWTDQQRMIGADPIQNPARIGWREYNVRLDAI